jgi:arylsulfatase A-like enzyme
MISGIDHVAGRLIKQLQDQGIADNTIIIYSADNGYYLGDRGFAGKWTHYDESLRVPMIIYDPRASQDLRGQVRSELVLNSDLASTMIDLAGESPPASHTGQSLKPLLQGNAPSDWRTDFLCEFLAVPRSIPKWEGVRGTNWSYARYYVDGPNEKPQEFLYDLQADPDQLANLAERSIADLTDVQQAAWKRLRARTDELVAQNGPSMTAMFGKRASVKRKNDRKKPVPTSKSK